MIAKEKMIMENMINNISRQIAYIEEQINKYYDSLEDRKDNPKAINRIWNRIVKREQELELTRTKLNTLIVYLRAIDYDVKYDGINYDAGFDIEYDRYEIIEL